jgi:hypothetical protein
MSTHRTRRARPTGRLIPPDIPANLARGTDEWWPDGWVRTDYAGRALDAGLHQIEVTT